MATDGDRRAWVTRVLGINSPGPGSSGRIRVLPIWQVAKEAADSEIAKLQDGFRATGHPLGKVIADKGLAGLSRRLFVPVVAALMDYDADAGQAAASQALSALDRVQEFVASHPALPVLERNPFGVTVTLRKTLGTAAHRIAAEIGRL
jgi:hypothetical protein